MAAADSTIASAPHRSSRVRSLVAAALIAALMAASGWLAIPLPGSAVPVTLQTFGVVLAALLLPAAWAVAALGVYVLLGAIGVPVFANHAAGLGVIVGPTGGYLIGFIVAAGLGALTLAALSRAGAREIVSNAAAAFVVLVTVYAIGTVQLAIVLHLSPMQAVLAGVAPFVVPDVIKAAVAVVVALAVGRALGGAPRTR